MYPEPQKQNSPNFKKVWLANVCHKNIGFLSNILVRTHKKSKSYQASIQCWAIIGTQAKRHLIGALLVNADPLFMVFGSAHQVKNKNRKGQDFEKKQQQQKSNGKFKKMSTLANFLQTR